jgi:hypothetical protein
MPSSAESTLAFKEFAERRHRLPPLTNERGCNLETDSEGLEFLWAQDHDDDQATPIACAGLSLDHVTSYDAFGYDAVFAIAHALHDLLYVQNRSQVVGSELLETLLKRVRFEGVTGLVDFFDASSEEDRLYNGDRRVGFSLELQNFGRSPQDWVGVGILSQCTGIEGCGWSDRWHPSGVDLTFSTADNNKPQQTAICPYGEVLTSEGACACNNGFELEPSGEYCRRCEINQHSIRATENISGSAGCTLYAAAMIEPVHPAPAFTLSTCDLSLAVARMATTGSMPICQRPHARRAALSGVFIVGRMPRCRRLTLKMATGAIRGILWNCLFVRGTETGAPVVVDVMLASKGTATAKSASTGRDASCAMARNTRDTLTSWKLIAATAAMSPRMSLSSSPLCFCSVSQSSRCVF